MGKKDPESKAGMQRRIDELEEKNKRLIRECDELYETYQAMVKVLAKLCSDLNF